MTQIRSGILAVSVAALAATAAFSPAAFAAAAAPGGGRAPTTVGTVFTNQEALDKGNTARVGSTAPMVSVNMFNEAPFNVNVEQRIAGDTPPSIHLTDAELFVVIDGDGQVRSGGELVDGVTRGANVNGTSIKDGVTRDIHKGDFIFIPAGQPHQIMGVKNTLTMMALHMPLPQANAAAAPSGGAMGAPPAAGAAGPGAPGGGRGGRGAAGAGAGGQ